MSESSDIPDWSTPDGPWCLKQWLPYNVPDPKIDTCLRELDHDGNCRGIHGRHYERDIDGMIVGQLKNVSKEEATASRRAVQEEKIRKVSTFAREMGASVELISDEDDFTLTVTLPIDYLEREDA